MMPKGMLRLIRSLAIMIIAAVVLSGCAGNSPKDEVNTGRKKVFAITPEMRADFDAAVTLMKDGEYQKGIEMMDKVVAKSQNHPVPYINLGIAHAKLGNLKAAEDNLKLALNLEPDNPVANNEYGLLYRKTGRFSEARQLYENLLEKYPYYPLVHKNLGILCDLYLRDYECALREYEFYSGAMPDDKNAKIWIADVQRRLGK